VALRRAECSASLGVPDVDYVQAEKKRVLEEVAGYYARRA
jgi:hypothetical protein